MWVQSCPSSRIPRNSQRKGVLWWDREIDDEIKIRNKLWKKGFIHHSIEFLPQLKQQKKKIKQLIKTKKTLFWEKVNRDRDINGIHRLLRYFRSIKNPQTIVEGETALHSDEIITHKLLASSKRKSSSYDILPR